MEHAGTDIGRRKTRTDRVAATAMPPTAPPRETTAPRQTTPQDTRLGRGAAVLGVFVWASGLIALLIAFGDLPSAHAPATDVVPIQIVEAPPVATPLHETSPAETAETATARPGPTTRSPAPHSAVPSPSPAKAPPHTDRAESRRERESPPPAPAPAQAAPVPAPPSALSPPSHDTPSETHADSASKRDGSSEAPANASSNSSPSNAEHQSGSSGARAIYQPLPDVPDEAREEAFTAIALARFVVHADGHCDVSLIEPTRNPTLNRLLLTSLRQWRFAPATEGGHAVETTIDLRVHFNVQ